ncbi:MULTISPECIES: tRNA (N6-isopentenyl adenosine(37)-C2)-methylthiotransferase MiaB [Clostridium]|uniref:tRNA-2-methylthio-N(6)-dimethylallyladenosine synthase n=2 Tax=Clostridium TaxID=1485 RepID=A0A151AQE2_9CLOT|nr:MULTISPECIES: tRNA (N6-isopentenyl adenosine(37)-C2)-methylthiotransferase MiaB [Clostridium]MBE6079010.1 tRNA (N6-isopentenyl adenosine(37)-C2)-methylthiotransferase MiaB [Clostridium lundense]KYH29856.1 tRNA-2-methylthio-N(6)-dimethylallyladenosine synthase [Clostridium colicanis DSM 13634]MBE6042689.1 tRNA (N6-isopentenyl adenosine(37)-C2)-methylthiotransferase MiaB [Clostridium thermopalmarium]PRR75237.1 (Dimethylallyl)adenosine tRNA methylthiotransferase MiaB [Clostridium thermopalmariu
MTNLNQKYYIDTWGCQMNEEDSEKISGLLKGTGYKRTNIKEEADIIIFNTCCVRENAEQKVYGHLGSLKALKRKKPNLIIVVTGCMMQQKGMPDKVIKKFPYIDIIAGSYNSYKLPEYIERVKTEGKSIIEVWNKEKGIVEGLPVDRMSNVKAFVTIMYGCNNFCSYCIVPYVRGRERSREPENIINEIKDLVSKGYKEITLLGQNVNSYGKGLEPEIDFAELLKRVNKIEGLERIRFMTSHPKDVSDRLISAMAECEKVCEHGHFALQSGSSRILEKMNRKYTREQYLELVKKLRKAMPDIAITTDIIVGFPGETEEDFNDTLSIVKEIEFDSVFTFIYSQREGTPAANHEDQIPEDVKHERFNRLVKVVNDILAKKNKEYEGKIVEVLVEGPSKNDETKLMGRTRTNKLVNFEGNNDIIGKLVKVKIIKAQSFSLIGEIV